MFRDALRALNPTLPTGRTGAVVLAYHLVDGGTGGVVDLPRRAFETQLAYLQRTRRVVSLDAVEPDGDPRQAVLTFDDAYQNFYDVVWPLLVERSLPALLYVPIAYLDGGPAPIRDTTLPPCTWDQLREMVGQGLQIGSHTVNHPDVGTLDATGLEREIVASRSFLEDRLQVPVTSFCYPRGLVHHRAEPYVERTYDTATVGGGRRYGPQTDPHHVERISIRRDHDLGTFAAMLDAELWLEEHLADRFRQLRR